MYTVHLPTYTFTGGGLCGPHRSARYSYVHSLAWCFGGGCVGVHYQSSGAQIRNQISVFGNLWHRDVRYKICTAQGCRTAQTRNHIRVFGNVWHRDGRYKICTAQGCRTDQTRRHRDALHIYGTGMPRHGDALYIYGMGMPRHGDALYNYI